MKSKRFNQKWTYAMKRIGYVAVGIALFVATACETKDDISTYSVKVKLLYPEGYSARSGVKVILANEITKAVFDANTNDEGIAELSVISGTYTATASDKYSVGGNYFVFNAGKSNLTIVKSRTDDDEIITLELTKSKLGQLVIKEYYFNGCQKNDGSGAFQRDAYVILYNNSDQSASLQNLCFGATIVANSQATNNDYVNGELFYAAEGWVPAGFGTFYFDSPVTLQPGEQIVVAINSANNHLTTYTNSVNLANANYYVFYDPSAGFTNATYHPAPDASIPESHRLKAIRFSGVTSNAYTMSTMSPAFFIFSTEGTTPVAYAGVESNRNLYNNSNTQVRLKVPFDWVIDGVEVFQQDAAANKKRFPAAVDAGYIEFPDVKQGYALYRNVDKEATEAIAANAGKLAYNYAGAIAGSSDPSGIDAEASIKNGARIIYRDTNNAGADFHVRAKSSLRE